MVSKEMMLNTQSTDHTYIYMYLVLLGLLPVLCVCVCVFMYVRSCFVCDSAVPGESAGLDLHATTTSSL